MLFAVFILSTLALASSQQPTADGDSAPAFVPFFRPTEVLEPTTPPTVEPLGPNTGQSCLTRFGPVCTFTEPDRCCNVAGNTLALPGLTFEVPCAGAKMRYNTNMSAAFTEEQCLRTKANIAASGGFACSCAAAPTPAPEILVRYPLLPY